MQQIINNEKHDIAIVMSSSRADPVLGFYRADWRDLNF